ncbi:hypothetical protein LOTGIDRAFT_51526, partial [Lottia gigantea]
LMESKPSGTLVGNIAAETNIARGISISGFKSLRYSFLNPNDVDIASLFSVDSTTSDITSNKLIDREKVCEFTADCVLTFDVKINSLLTSFFEIVTIKIIVDDVNDNAPIFPESEITVFIPENVNPGTMYRIDGATDKDRGKNNSVQSYEMISSANTFGLKVDKKLDGTSDVRIIVKNVIDREKKNYYRFFIIAKDGGNPPLSGNVTVNVNVSDENDNAPEFSEQHYDVSVTENTPVYSVIAKIHATDRDSGMNAKVVYRFSPHKSPEIEKLFALNPENGDISVRNELQYQSGNQFETIIEASDQGVPEQVSQAKLTLRILDVGNNPPLVTINPVSSGVGDMVLLSEGARVGTVVAHVNIVDKDVGPNGQVQCNCPHDFFSVHRLEGRGYIVQVKRILDRERNDEHKVMVICRDSGTPRLSARAKFTVRLTDMNDEPPVFTKRVFETSVEENNVIGRPIIRISANDADIGKNAIVQYHLNLADDSMFRINQNTGEIVANARFDRETMSEMKFTVRAVDEGNPPLTGTAEVLVRIIDENDNRPTFDASSLVFSINEDKKPGSEVGILRAKDADFNFNSDVEYAMLVNGAENVPFAVFSNGVIRTNKALDYEEQKRYSFNIIAKDKGRPPLNTTARVLVYVMDANDHSPIIVFPNSHNDTITVTSDTEPGTVITKVVAKDRDEGDNARLSYYINKGNVDNTFHIGSKSGEIVLARRLMLDEREDYHLTVSVQDQGKTQQASQTYLTVRIIYVNVTYIDSTHEDLRYIIIAGVVTGVTVILSIIIVAVILYVRRSDNQRRH